MNLHPGKHLCLLLTCLPTLPTVKWLLRISLKNFSGTSSWHHCRSGWSVIAGWLNFLLLYTRSSIRSDKENTCEETVHRLLIFSWVPDSFKILIKAMVIFFPEKCTITNICIQLQGIHEAPGSLWNLQGNLLIYFSRLRTWGEEEAVLKEKGGVVFWVGSTLEKKSYLLSIYVFICWEQWSCL